MRAVGVAVQAAVNQRPLQVGAVGVGREGALAWRRGREGGEGGFGGGRKRWGTGGGRRRWGRGVPGMVRDGSRRWRDVTRRERGCDTGEDDAVVARGSIEAVTGMAD